MELVVFLWIQVCVGMYVLSYMRFTTFILLIAGDFRIVSYLLLFIFRCDEVKQEAQRK